jgi:hypothetical protein
MPIFEKEKNSSISPVLLLLIVVLGVLGGFIYNSQITPATDERIKPIKSISPEDTLSKLKSSKLDFSILEDETFKNLKVFVELPINAGETGRENIFLPF